jgi:hypothetical protein
MKRSVEKWLRFTWRMSRNLACMLPGGVRLLFPPEALAQRFGRGDAEYAVTVYLHHARQLASAGFLGAARILETGPGRNLGSALLWWCRARAEGRVQASVFLWDVHANAHPGTPGYWQELAQTLLPVARLATASDHALTASQLDSLHEVAQGTLRPEINYLVCPIEDLAVRLAGQHFDLLLSHAALEHVWRMEDYWRIACALGEPGAWQSHRIDLADHGRRQGNYLEMCEWSPLTWWLTMRFVPGAINRWRASQHRSALEASGYRIMHEARELRPALPIALAALALPFRRLPEDELRTTAVDLVAQCEERACAC